MYLGASQWKVQAISGIRYIYLGASQSQWEVIGIWRDESEICGGSKYADKTKLASQYSFLDRQKHRIQSDCI